MGMMRRKFPHEIKAYKSVMFYGLTARQIICVVCALALAIPTAIIASKLGASGDTIGYIIIFEAIPFGAAGWIEYNDMALEKIANQIIKFYSGTRKRKWQFINPETRVHEAIVQIDFEAQTQERKKEIEKEKQKSKKERKLQKERKREERKLRKVKK